MTTTNAPPTREEVLLPCGHCQAPARFVERAWRVKCTRQACGLEGGKFETRREAIAAWNTRATPAASDEAVERVIAEVMDDGEGFWRACSGCQESVDGHVSTKDYPWSSAFRCQPGGGCRECGGIGVLWDTTDYEAMARYMLADDAALAAMPTPTDAQRERGGEVKRLVSDIDRELRGAPGSPDNRRAMLRRSRNILAALTPPEEARADGIEAAWRDGWAECKARLSDDAAFELTTDVECDAWLDSATAALKEPRP